MSVSLWAKPSGGKNAGERSKAMDLVTGKAVQEYYFDPTLVLSESSSITKTPSKVAQSRDAKDALFFQSKYLFVPCTIIKPIVDEENPPQFGQKPALPSNTAPGSPPPIATPPPAPSVNAGKKKKKKKGKGGQNNPSTTIPGSDADAAPVHEPAGNVTFNPNQPYPGPTLVKSSDGALHKISDSTKLIPMNAADYEGVPDILRLSDVSEASLLHTLRLRYRRDEVYTAAGQILISINPYKQIATAGASIYSEEQMMIYRRKGWSDKPPHLFQVADRAYSALVDSVHSTAIGTTTDPTEGGSDTDHQHEARQFPPGKVRNQSIIISGESGAGKTEATKIIMTFLAKITRKNGGSMIEALAERVLSSNPLLETFGNAQTLRNNNSSRFGKFIHIYFDCLSGAITGASISNYLLEKTRITNQVEGERNYHIFYQLLSGADGDMAKAFGLEGGPGHFRYLGNKGETSPDDRIAFSETVSCLKSIGLSEQEQRSVFGMAAAVLHLGNVQFEEGDAETAKVSENSMPSLCKACESLGIDVDAMSEAILTKIIFVNGSPIHKPQNVALAEDKRDALAKMTYSCLFLWLVNCVNEKLRETSATGETDQPNFRPPVPTETYHPRFRGFIGCLDIYGFESFDINGFEQLLINYCNETLQRHFNRHLFEVEQDLYANEGVDWSYITFNDNRPCLELIEGGGGSVGILNALDDAWSGMGNAAKKEVTFAKTLQCVSHPNFITSKFGNDREFTIVHYAGSVKYTVDSFVEKNMETMSNELRELGERSTNAVAKKVYASNGNVEGSPSTAVRSSIRGVSVGSQFRTSLQSLVYDLERTQPHYIRCIKPNQAKASGSFMAGEVLKQLRYSGMMEAIRIRQDGYALREEHESFFERFSVLLSPTDLEVSDSRIVQLVTALSARLGVSDADWQVGHSKIFLRRQLSDKLERMAKLRIHCAARTLTKFGVRVARRRAAVFIVTYIRFWKRSREKRRVRRAASKIAGLARRYIQRLQYSATLRAIVRIQTLQRRILAVHRVRKLEDPFYDLTFRECKALLLTEKQKLESAVRDRNFNRAKELEQSIISIRTAIKNKRPVTRAAVDEQIASVKIELDEAVKRLAFDECGPLQDKLDELTAKQAELPTVDELRAAVAAAEASMSLAAKNRDFASAAAAQANIAEAQKRLLDTLAANEDTENGGENQKKSSSSITSPLELRLEIKSLKAAVDDAVSRKDFASAASLTDTLAGLEKKLECELLTQQELTKAAPTLASAVLENGEKVVFASRTELERTIASAMYSVSQFASGRDFKKAAAAQTRVDDMVKLRELLPSAEELKQQIISTTREMEVAVSNKEFVTAEKLSHAIEEMERKMKNAGASVPAHISSTEHTEEYRAEPGIPARASVSEATKNVAPLKLPAVAKVPASMPIAPTAATAVVPKAIVRAATSSSSVQSRLSASVKGDNSGRAASIMSVVSTKQAGQSITEVQRTVAKLRPADPLIGNVSETVHAIAKRLTTNRRNACMLVDENGMLAGILTDTDITRRVASKFLDPADTVVSSVMTPRPTCVSMTDAAMDALTIMVENRFRHLPVVDSAGSLVGGLDLTKCLNDAITKLEKNHEKASRSAESIVHQVLSRQTNGGGVEAASLQALLGSLMAQAMGSPTMPTIQGLLTGKPGTIVGPDSSIRDASILMSDNRKAALVVQGGELLGVFTFKDLMTRAIAKELPLDTTPVSEVMTPSPEYITPDKTVLEALQLMHDHRFLTLPVCEDDGTVIGLVDAMDVIYGCGGADGWKSLFSTAMGLQDDSSDVLSIGGSRAPKSLVSGLQPPPRLVSLDETIPIRPKSTANDKTVAKLRPSPPCLSRTDDSILSVAQLLKSKRLSASLVVRGDGTLAGIVTDTDITRRVVAKNVDPEYTSISDIMTPDPTVVATTDAAMDALTIMVENRFRHLPVVDDEGSVVGVLDVAKCLDDAISKLEKSHEQGQVTTEVAVKQAIVEQGGNVAQASALLALLGNILSQNMGGKGIPTLRAVLAGKPSSIVSPNSSVREAGMRMAECRKAALIVDHGELVGIFSFKDCMVRAVAAGLPLESTPVCQVMTPNPEFVSPDATVLEALQIMHDHRFLTLPVCESDGTVMGVADVMDVICASGGPDGWRSIFSSAMHLDDGSVGASGMSKQIASAVSARGPQAVKAENRPQVASAVPSNIPATLEFFDADGDNSFTGSTIGDERGVSKLLSPEDTSGSMGILDFVSFKVTTSSGSTHRIRCEPTVKDLAGAIEAKSSIPQSRMRIEYEDDEGDVVVISNDDDVTEAFKLARKSGKKIAKLTVVETEVKAKAVSTALIGGGLAAVALLGAFAVLMLRPKKH